MKSTKKLIAVILAVLMVFTTAPLSAFAANSLSHSKDDAVATELKSAITTYESKMDGTLYKNMSTAYTAYISARKAYAAYVYGNASIDLSTYTKTLNNALTAMTPWTAATFGTTGYYADSVATGGYSNVVYSSKTLNISSKYTDKGYVETKLAAPKAVVFAYDGRTANNVYGPVVLEVLKTGASWTKKQLKYAEITDAFHSLLKRIGPVIGVKQAVHGMYGLQAMKATTHSVTVHQLQRTPLMLIIVKHRDTIRTSFITQVRAIPILTMIQ